MKPFILTSLVQRKEYEKELYAIVSKTVHLLEIETTLFNDNGVFVSNNPETELKQNDLLLGILVELKHLFFKYEDFRFVQKTEGAIMVRFNSLLGAAHGYKEAEGKDFLDHMSYLNKAICEIAKAKNDEDILEKIETIRMPKKVIPGEPNFDPSFPNI